MFFKKILDFDNIEKIILNSKPTTSDINFIQKFMKTQLFRNFLEDFYHHN